MINECVDLNKSLQTNKLVKLTWGNVSVRDFTKDHVYIKPSGVPFGDLKDQDISVIDLKTGNQISGLKPSVDLPIHMEIYKNFKEVGSVVHTHSKYATSWAQAEKPIPCLGTTHADYFPGNIDIVRDITPDEIAIHYEKYIGRIVANHFNQIKVSPNFAGAVLLPKHGVLTFASSGKYALERAIVLEEVAEMAMISCFLNPEVKITKSQEFLFKKHYTRKHGENKYYGQ